MDKAVIRYVFDKRKEADNNTKTGILHIEVRERKTNNCVYINTGIKLYKNQFSSLNGFTCVKHSNAAAITSKARREFDKIEKFVLSDKCKTVKDAKNYENEVDSVELIPFMIKELALKNIEYTTAYHHVILRKQLKDFKKIIYFSDLTYNNIVLFDKFLRDNGLGDTTRNKRHSVFRQYTKKAVFLGLLGNDPYEHFKIPSPKHKEPVYLIENEINKILKYTPSYLRLEQVKDLFIFQMFTGMAYVDLMKFSRLDISAEGEYKIIRSNRSKTDEQFVSLFLPEAEKIADKYNYKLPNISNQEYNRMLKVLAGGAEINKNLTTHVARHTYATYLLNRGIPIETVSKALGHSDLKMTQHYARLLGKKIISDMKKLLDN